MEFIFETNYDKKGITKGTIEEFEKFIIQKTKLEIQKI